MRSEAHAESSAKIFGGEPKDYQDIHAVIDQNKSVHASPKGRFFLHHYDVGGAILVDLFGTDVLNSAGTLVDVKDVLMQHLIEDYGQVPLFKDWIDSFAIGEVPLKAFDIFLARPRTKAELFDRLVSAKLVPKGRKREMYELLGRVYDTVSLEKYTEDGSIKMTAVSRCIFGHYTGLDLLRRIINASDQAADDFVFLVFGAMMDQKTLDPKRPNIQTLLDWMKSVEELPWMLPPKDLGRHNPKFVKAEMEKIKAGGSDALGIKKGKEKPKPKLTHGQIDDFMTSGRYSDPHKCTGGRMD